VSTLAWIACLGWIAIAAATAAIGARRGLREGRGPNAAARLKRPTVYLFAAYLLVAAFVTPRSAGESTSPLFWLAIVLPIGFALATLASLGSARRPAAVGALLGLLHGGAVLAAAAVVLSLASPAFVPAWLR
jgi:hypothetical protein